MWNTEHLHKLYTFLLKEGRRNQSPGRGPGLAPSTIRGIHSALHSALAAAVEERLLPANPADRVVLPKGEKPSLSILTSRQMERFLAAIRADDIWHDFFYIELTTGLRRGELCGLRWEDFNEATGELAIRCTVHANSTVGDTKTYAGTRRITLPASATKCLRKGELVISQPKTKASVRTIRLPQPSTGHPDGLPRKNAVSVDISLAPKA